MISSLIISSFKKIFLIQSENYYRFFKSLVGLNSRLNETVNANMPRNYSPLSGLRCVIAIFFIVVMIFFQNANAGWQTVSTGVPNNDIWSVQFINSNTGWIIGNGGLIRKTTDSGNSWVTQTSNTSQTLRRIRMYNADTGYISGHGGTILKTNNGGTNWTLYTRPGGNSFYGGTDNFGSQFVYAAGSGLTYSKTTDGGLNWINGTITGISSFDIYALDVIDQNTFYISGAPTSIPAYPRIYKTTNGGANYTDVFSSSLITLYVNSSANDIKFINQNTGFACFTNGVVAKTTNAGSSWNTTTLQFGTDLRQIDFLSSGDSGYVSAFGGKIFYTTNTGTSWNLIAESGTTNNLTSVSLSGGNKWCGGYSGTLVKYFPPQPRVIVTGAVTGNGSYDNLSEAFTSINSGSQSGANIVVSIDSNTNEPTAGAVLNNGNWNSMIIQPAPGTSKTISGNTSAGVPLIDLNGADNVRIDGVNSGGTSLTFTNASTSSTAGTSTIRFQNDATNNKITNCKIYGSTKTDFTSYCATVLFAGTYGSSGNDNNSVSYCDIGPAGSNLPACAVYFFGTTTNSTLYNSNDTISNCNIYDFYNANGNNTGVMVSTGNTAISISNNKLYQTSLRTGVTSSSQHSVIQINNPSGNDFRVTGNTIGFSSAAGTGTYSINGASSAIFFGIYLIAGTTGESLISNNLISSISLGNSGAGVYLIQVSEGLTTISNNTIGSLTSNGNIVFNSSFSAVDVLGIGVSPTANANVSSNRIGGITATGIPAKLYGIRFVCNGSSSPVWTCSGNIIGGTPGGSMNNTFTTSGTLLFGISAERNAGTPSITIENNVIRNMTSQAGGPGTSVGVAGIYLNFLSGNFIAQGNTIHSLSNTNSSLSSSASGIKVISGSGSVSSNLIHSISVSLSNSIITGIMMVGGTCDFINNMISLGKDSLGNSISTGCTIYGMNIFTGVTSNCRYNSVYLTGSPTSGNLSTYAFYSNVLTNARNYYNNIFYNSRSNSGGTSGKHYAIVLAGSSPNPSGLTCNYNDLYVNGSGGTLGFFNNTNYTSLSSWQTATGKDSNSISSNPRIISHTNLHIDSTTQSPVSNAGVNISGITSDLDGNVRSATTPDIGADEFNSITSGEVLNFDGTNDFVALPNSMTQTFTSPSVNEITIEYWFKGSNLQSAVRFQTSSSNYIVAGWGTVGNQKHLISVEGGTGGGVKVGNGINDGNWHHIAMTWKRNTVNGFRSYLDGSLVEAKNASDVALPVLTSGGYLGVQGYNNSEYMNGSLDEVRIWTRALSQSEIAGNRFHEIDSASGLLASYHFNQGAAGGNNSGVTSLTDATSNMYSGTLTNFTLTGGSSNWIIPGPGFCTPYIEANVTGNGFSIADGDITPTPSDFTDLGSVSAGGTITRTYSVQNSGLDSLSVGNPYITGTDSAKFTAGVLSTSGKIAPGSFVTFTVTFNPGSSGVKNAVLHVPNNDCDEYDYDFAIKGTGTAAIAQTLNFDGINDNVELPVALTQSLTAPTVSEFTIEYWFKGSYIQSAVRFQAAGGFWIVAGWGAQGSEKHLISTEGGTNGISVGAGVSDGNWHHIAMTWKKNTVNGFKSYLDGVLVDQKNTSNSDLPAMSVKGYLGRYELGNEYMQGTLDEVRIWTRELSQQEIAMNRFVQMSYGTGLLASYHFNQGFAGDNNSAVTTLTDASPNNFSGTLNNFALNGVTSNWISPPPFTCNQYSEINIKGNNFFILDGDSTASLSDFTDFGFVESDTSRVSTFYIKNTGTDSLTVASIVVTGTDAGKFSCGPLTPSGKIRQGDSASFDVTFTPSGTGIKTAVVHIANNDCNESDYDFKIKGTGVASINITSIVQGFYDASSDMQNLSDTMRVYLCNSVSPFNVVDSAKGKIDSLTHSGSFAFNNAPAGNYYLKLVHRNSIETWSASLINLPSTSVYDFTTMQSQSYGDNSIQVNASPVRFAIYSGDENQDGTIDVGDIVDIYNDALNGASGYVNTDINGDDFVDVSDIIIAYNNSINVISVVAP